MRLQPKQFFFLASCEPVSALWRDTLEVVEATAAQRETPKFNGTGLGDGQGQAVQSRGCIPVPASRPSLQSDAVSQDTRQTKEVQPAKEQPPEFAPQSSPDLPTEGTASPPRAQQSRRGPRTL
ncbi:H/ACA ribonucleoprotein complex non-core subunit NAF1-like [Lutra lutra]|uniref:H/ACA ribonucleoprotein complex non-core subunit NAF1-like n=1 Tax=Lutra lutra TaxID=9657 RepID=UPI001FD11FBC|nr:H/ACA ribonucleoprotein complex non-core subunit NAF1-like [Lutra lutra]